IALVQTQFANQNNKLTKVDKTLGKLGESVGSFDGKLHFIPYESCRLRMSFVLQLVSDDFRCHIL
ncbi:hypothetical protein ACUOFC_53900, partial [Escherichia sp. TWPC-MK]